MRGTQKVGLFDGEPDPSAAPAPEAPRPAAGRRTSSGKAKPKKPEDPSPFPDMDTLDPVIYGVRRPVSGEELLYLRRDMGDAEFEAWKLRNLPLVCHYTLFHFTPEGKVKLLRLRQYSDTDIARMYPDLAPSLEG